MIAPDWSTSVAAHPTTRAAYPRALRLAHFIGLAMFLGSILAFIVISNLGEDAPLAELAFGRRVISAGTYALTLPGMWLMALTGPLMGWRRYGLQSGFFRIKIVLMLVVVLNAHLMVVPAANEATQLALQAASAGQLGPAFHGAYLRETIFGTLNVLLILSAAAVGVWRIGAKRARAQQTARGGIAEQSAGGFHT